jgi:hypothetical protein
MTARRTLAFVALVLAPAMACDVGSNTSGIGSGTNDVVLRIVNTTGVALDLTSNGQFVGGDGHVTPGTTSACIRIDPATTTALGLREAGAVSDVGSFAPTLTPKASYTVVAFISAAGSVSTFTLPNEYIPTTGLAGFRVVDVAPGLGTLDVYVTPRSGPLDAPSTASIGFGGNTGFFDINPGSSQVRFTVATTRTLVFDAGAITLFSGQLSTMVLSQPGGASGTPVATLVPAC